jgi:hypothetical protein
MFSPQTHTDATGDVPVASSSLSAASLPEMLRIRAAGGVAADVRVHPWQNIFRPLTPDLCLLTQVSRLTFQILPSALCLTATLPKDD